MSRSGRPGKRVQLHRALSKLGWGSRRQAWDWIRAYGKVEDQPPPRSTRVFVYEGGKVWRDLGEVGKGSRVLCLGSYKGTERKTAM